MLTASPTAESLACAVSFDHNAVAKLDGAAAPPPPAAACRWIVCGKLAVRFQLGLDRGQVRASLPYRVGDDPDVRLALGDGGREHVGERADGALGAAARAENIQSGAAMRIEAI